MRFDCNYKLSIIGITISIFLTTGLTLCIRVEEEKKRERLIVKVTVDYKNYCLKNLKNKFTQICNEFNEYANETNNLIIKKCINNNVIDKENLCKNILVTYIFDDRKISEREISFGDIKTLIDLSNEIIIEFDKLEIDRGLNFDNEKRLLYGLLRFNLDCIDEYKYHRTEEFVEIIIKLLGFKIEKINYNKFNTNVNISMNIVVDSQEKLDFANDKRFKSIQLEVDGWFNSEN